MYKNSIQDEKSVKISNVDAFGSDCSFANRPKNRDKIRTQINLSLLLRVSSRVPKNKFETPIRNVEKTKTDFASF